MLGISELWITFGPILVINIVFISSYIIYRLYVRKKKKRTFEGAKTQGSSILSSEMREWWFWLTNPIVTLFIKMRLTPNAITVLGFFVSSISAYLFSRGSFGYAGWMLFLGASFDMFDGRVARMTGRTSRSGGYFDSVIDRYQESVTFLALAWYFKGSWFMLICIAALVGSVLVSYTRARGEGVGINCSVGIMQRPERIFYLGVAAIFQPVADFGLSALFAVQPPFLLMFAILFIAVLSNVTALHRMIYVMNALDNEDRKEKDSLPQIITKLTTPSGREELWDKARYGYDRTKSIHSPVMFFHTGIINSDLFNMLLEKGDLPNISKHLAERGGAYEAVSSFPATTGPSQVAYVTGCHPGTCDIPGVRWFDRKVPESRILTMNRFRDYLGWGAYAMDYDLSKSVRTVYEYSKQAVNIFGLVNRGCGLVRDPAFFRMHSRFHQAKRSSDLEAADEAAFHWFSSAVRRETDFILYSFPPMAFAGLEDASEIRHSYLTLDKYIGRAADLLKEKGMYDNAVMMLVSDGCLGERKNIFNINEFMDSRWKLCPAKHRTNKWQESNAVVLNSGTSMCHIYLRLKESWNEGSFFEEVEGTGIVGSLLEKDGVDFIAGRSVDGGIMVQSRRGKAHILEDAGGRVTYIVKGRDPFGYEKIDQVTNSERILSQTFDSNYPDGIIQLLQIFRSERTGDLIVSAKNDTSLVRDDEIWQRTVTCGSLSSVHSKVPVISSHNLLKTNIRSVDLLPTALTSLGIDIAHSTDGRSVIEAVSDSHDNVDSLKVEYGQKESR